MTANDKWNALKEEIETAIAIGKEYGVNTKEETYFTGRYDSYEYVLRKMKELEEAE